MAPDTPTVASELLPSFLRYKGFPGGDSGKESACQCRKHELWVQSMGQEDPLEEGIGTHYSILS